MLPAPPRRLAIPAAKASQL